MAQKIENFIFDIDGTLIDTIDMYMPAMIDTLAQHGHPVAPDKVEQTKHELLVEMPSVLLELVRMKFQQSNKTGLS